ncbi:MAG: SH3 domain-containing protein [Bacteriovoracaceae bacterium]|jgi:hypothetical protein|nr:SH3 domain-containing protein [Bacteriovoracaceae bacterium]
MNLYKSIILVATLVISAQGFSYNTELFDGNFLTMNSDQAVVGPIFNGDEATYINEVFENIYIEAEKIADAEYLKYGDEKAYWSFLFGSLIVPYHESYLTHFRKQANKNCSYGLNSGSRFKSKSSWLHKIFMRNFKVEGDQVTPNCDQIDGQENYFQLLNSQDYYSTGIMQIAINWHEEEYTAPRKFLSIPESIEYGLSIFNTGFKTIYHNSSSYWCIKNTGVGQNPANFEYIIRGAWAGVYNSGKLSRTCRFKIPSDSWYGNDKGFFRSLNSIKSKSGNQYSIHLNPENLQLYQKIVNNFKKANTDTLQFGEGQLEDTEDYLKVTAGGLNVRKGGSTRYDICGTISYGQIVKRVASQGSWVKIETVNLSEEIASECGENAFVHGGYLKRANN